MEPRAGAYNFRIDEIAVYLLDYQESTHGYYCFGKATGEQSNYKSRSQFTNPNKASDVVTIPITNNVQTMGWTTDVVLTPFKGFTFHGLLTLQDPKYKNFNITANFSDGTSKSYDFSNKITTGVSKTIIELDPSYMFGKFRVWASFRYQSKQYINKTNTLYFNGRWETFGGLDYSVNKFLSLSCNVINFFCLHVFVVLIKFFLLSFFQFFENFHCF